MYDQARIGGHRDTELNNDGTRSVISMENNGTLFPEELSMVVHTSFSITFLLGSISGSLGKRVRSKVSLISHC